MDVQKMVDSMFGEVVALRRALHAAPELSGCEQNTARFISDYLTKIGVAHTNGVAGHGIVAEVGRGAGRVVGIRADIDALPIQEETGLPYASRVPGVMHACGHDMHTAILMGTANIFKQMEDSLPGKVKFFFQPAEETTGAAAEMIAAGCMENPHVSRMLALHVTPSLPEGKVEIGIGAMSATSTEVKITVRGVQCHGAHPEQGKDAILAASHIVVALQSLSSRANAPTTPVIVTIGSFHGGTKENIVAGEVTLLGTLRALDKATMAGLKQGVRTVAENTARAYGAEAEVELVDSYPALVNDAGVCQCVADVVREYLGEESLVMQTVPSLGTDDGACFLDAAPGCYFSIGVRKSDAKHPQALHNCYFDPSESAMKTGMLVEVAGALRLMAE